MLVVGVLLLALAGCIRVDQTLTLNADGSGTLAMRYGMSEQTIAQLKAMEQLGAQGGQGPGMAQEQPFEFEPAEVRKAFEADKPAGVELTALSSEVVDGWKYIDLTVTFDDVRALKRTELFEDSKLAIERVGGGNYRLTQRGAGDVSAPGASEQQLMQQMSAMLTGFRIAQTLVVPGDIVDTNATAVDGRRATWVFDIAQDPDVINTLAQTDLELVFAGDGVQLPVVSP
jgi:hypothetical protein